MVGVGGSRAPCYARALQMPTALGMHCKHTHALQEHLQAELHMHYKQMCTAGMPRAGCSVNVLAWLHVHCKPTWCWERTAKCLWAMLCSDGHCRCSVLGMQTCRAARA